jgi:hypothetical protein
MVFIELVKPCSFEWTVHSSTDVNFLPYQWRREHRRERDFVPSLCRHLHQLCPTLVCKRWRRIPFSVRGQVATTVCVRSIGAGLRLAGRGANPRHRCEVLASHASSSTPASSLWTTSSRTFYCRTRDKSKVRDEEHPSNYTMFLPLKMEENFLAILLPALNHNGDGLHTAAARAQL